MKLTCTGCSLSKTGCICEDLTHKDIMLLSDKPTLEDINKDYLLSGKVGQQIGDYLASINLTRKDVHLATIVKGFVKPGKAVSIVALRKCFDTQVIQEIKTVKPKVIILMGATAYKGFRGKCVPGTHYYDKEFGCWIVYTHHPMKPIISGNGMDYTEIIAAFKQAQTLAQAGILNVPQVLPRPQITIVRDLSSLLTALSILSEHPYIGVDVETTGLNIQKDKALTIGLSNGKAHYGVIYTPEMCSAFNCFFSQVNYIGHNIKFDLQHLKKLYIYPKKILMCTLLAHYTLEPLATAHDLVTLSLKEFQTSFDKDLDYATLFNNGITPEILDLLAERGTLDAYLSYCLHEKYMPEIQAKFPKFYHDTIVPIAELLAEIEYNGIMINTKELYAAETFMAYKLKAMETDINKLPEIVAYVQRKQAKDKKFISLNLGSPKQMSEIIYDVFKIPEDSYLGRSTSKEALDKIAESNEHPVLAQLLEYRNVAKLQDTYIKGLKEALARSGTDRVHTSLHQEVVVTGRLSSSAPNLQTIPNEKSVDNAGLIRSLFTAPQGYTLVEMDYSQLEFRVWAHMCKDAGMLNMISDGGDIHKKMAGKINGLADDQVTDEQRYQAKEISFGLIYGMGVGSLAARTKLTIERAKQIKADFFRTFPDATVWLQQVADFGIQNKFVTTPFGRRIPIVFNGTNDEELSSARRRAVNYPIQSTAAELTNRTGFYMLKRVKELGIDAKIVLNVHDSLIWEVRLGGEQQIKDIALEAIAYITKELSFRSVLEAKFKKGLNLNTQEVF